jgi:hypothetical protein
MQTTATASILMSRNYNPITFPETSKKSAILSCDGLFGFGFLIRLALQSIKFD